MRSIFSPAGCRVFVLHAAFCFLLPVLSACGSNAARSIAVPGQSTPTPAESLPAPTLAATPTSRTSLTEVAGSSTQNTVSLSTQITPLPNLPGSALILDPGKDSRISSPLRPRFLLLVHEEGIVQIDLIGKNDLLYARQMLDLHRQNGQEMLLRPELPFEIIGKEAPARLVIRLLDHGGRTISLTSINIMLLAGGESEIQEARNNGWIQITSPEADVKTGGNKVHITARVSPANGEPLIAELLTADGAAINTKLVALPKQTATGSGEPVDLNFFLPYAIEKPTPCLLTLSQSSYTGIEGTLMLASVPITLLP